MSVEDKTYEKDGRSVPTDLKEVVCAVQVLALLLVQLSLVLLVATLEDLLQQDLIFCELPTIVRPQFQLTAAHELALLREKFLAYLLNGSTTLLIVETVRCVQTQKRTDI